MRFLIVRLRKLSGEKILLVWHGDARIICETALRANSICGRISADSAELIDRGRMARNKFTDDRRLEGTVVQAAEIARDAAARGDPQPVEAREPARYRGAAAREEADARRISIPRCARSARSTAPTTTSHIPRWAAAAVGSGATCRSNTRFPTRQLMAPSPRLVSRELMTRTRVSAGDHSQPTGGGLDSVHGARLVRAQTQRRRVR